MMSDVLPSMTPIVGNQVLVSLVLDDHEALKSCFDRLSTGGKVLLPLSSQPWSACFGTLVAPFGITWKFNSDAFSFLDRVLAGKN